MSSQKVDSLSRRNFIKGSALLGGASVLTGTTSAQAATAPKPSTTTQAKNMIFLIADGMCQGTLGYAHHWSLRERGEPLNRVSIYDHEGLHTAMQDTASASSPVTDSAAAASAWGSGQRVHNRAINTTPDGKALKPLMSYAKESGKATGLVSTCRITHATPAGFTASVPHRDDEDSIAQQYFDHNVDLMLGGGYRHFDNDTHSLISDFKAKGYNICRDKDALASTEAGQKVLGLFSDSHIPYALDRANDTSLDGVPDLPTMFAAALDNLKDAENGFVLQVEAGRIDHAGHANDPASILHEQLEYDACLPIALEFIKNHPDTLLIVTTDHGTGGCQLDGLGSGYNGSGPALDRISDFKRSFEWMEKQLRKNGTIDAELVEKMWGISITPAQKAALLKDLNDPQVKYLSNSFARVLEKDLVEKTATGWSSHNHTSENVELLAIGPGADQVKGFIKNYELFGIMTSALSIA